MQSHFSKAQPRRNDAASRGEAAGCGVPPGCASQLASSLRCSVQSNGRSSSVRRVAVSSTGCRPCKIVLPRIGRAYALARWPIDWGISIVAPVLVEKGVATGYGYKHTSYSIIFPGAPTGAVENALVSVSAAEAYDDFAEILYRGLFTSEISGPTASSSPRLFDNIVTSTSSGVFY